MILSQAQAENIYGAICLINNLGGSLQSVIEANDGRGINVSASSLGGVVVGTGLMASQIENYKTQAEFAEAYGLQ